MWIFILWMMFFTAFGIGVGIVIEKVINRRKNREIFEEIDKHKITGTHYFSANHQFVECGWYQSLKSRNGR